jgi:hypothetical protein
MDNWKPLKGRFCVVTEPTEIEILKSSSGDLDLPSHITDRSGTMFADATELRAWREGRSNE